jgi:nitrite reductase/ring-hydroxylating ferredoxin subunit
MIIELKEYKTFFKNETEYLYVCESKDILNRKGIKIQFPEDIDFQVAIFRLSDELHCLDNICPHRHADKIYDGIIKDNNVMCPLHGWTYSILTGENTNKHQGLKYLRKYDVFEENGKVYIEKPDFKIPKWRDF